MNSPPHTEGKLYTCIKCKEEFPLELDPKILEIVGGSLLCNTCSETHQPSAYYGQQQLEENSSVDGTLDEASKCEVFLVSDPGEDIYSCDVCCKTFSGASDLCAHLQHLPDEKLSNQPCDYYGQQQLEENSSVDGTLDEASKFKVFLVSDTGENIYSCDICCKTFSGDSDLCTHLQHFKKLSICGFCNKTFGTRSELKSHAITHTGKKQHVCSVCARAFSRRSYLRVHTRMHTGEKPYVCDVCSATFGQKSGLLLHASSHTGQKPFKCGHCPLTFVQSSHLRMHMRVHTGEKPYVCDVCDKAFAQRGTLLQHMRFHTGESPFACDVCDKTYSRNSYLKNHMRSHTGEKPYVCDACSVAFAQRFQLLAHSCPAAEEVSYRSGKSTTIYVKAPTLTVRKRVAKEESLASGAASEQRISEVVETNHACGECKKAFSNVYDLKFHQRSHEEEDTFFECDMCFKSFMKRDSLKLHQWRCHELNWNRLKLIKNFK